MRVSRPTSAWTHDSVHLEEREGVAIGIASRPSLGTYFKTDEGSRKATLLEVFQRQKMQAQKEMIAASG
jgi:hypothetical protein